MKTSLRTSALRRQDDGRRSHDDPGASLYLADLVHAVVELTRGRCKRIWPWAKRYWAAMAFGYLPIWAL